MFPKGGMGKLMKQAQEMQEKMAKAQEELGGIEVEGQSGGGMITALVNGKKELLSLKIEDEILEEDKEMIEDLVVAAVNQALQNATKAADEKMNSATGGMMGNMKIPGM
ncbi:MAG: YbaB/EbfC family nucleoid-associated protein [Candidatus Marinimicrobia bacterium]|jgi:hypothetical protein|nr:YbaB/EbfC family nucleoid-associated protein [Candidatus Neomarinimicrobiota bacterium]MBT5955357.1 YbaB/EbfC family nucleoid-associated protein [Candidatus Neomarinimicrobiota bacterium]MBT6871406.1 YbaB/EbfC family nucleoid-associated protein [Candidatus Neomarinimicrobiota bacterium]|tara:strand:- start:3173 stop:3499 length:327 start_codon:yes stop_codon:yes gene_type:complete